MLRFALVLTVVAAAVAESPAQTDPHAWIARRIEFLVYPGSVGVEVLDSDGQALAFLPYPVGSFSSGGGVAKHPSGRVFIAGGGASGDLRWVTPAAISPSIPAPDVNGLCIDFLGHVWTTQSALFGGPPVIVKRDGFGNPLMTIALPNGVWSRGTEPDALGRVWTVSGGTSPQVVIVDQAGTISGPAPIALSSTDTRLWVVARDSRLWYVDDSTPGAPACSVLDDSLTVQGSVSLPAAPTAIGLDRCGRPILTLTNDDLVAVNPETATLSTVLTLPAPSAGYRSVVVAPDGRIWLLDESSGSIGGISVLLILEADGSFVACLPAPPGTNQFRLRQGDPLGTELLAVADRGTDHDLDGVVSDIESKVGTNALDPASTPPVPILDSMPLQGGSFTVTTFVPGESGNLFVLGASGGTDGIVLDPADPCRVWPLSDDALFQYWIGPDNAFAAPVLSTLDAADSTTSTIVVPVAPFLSGFELSLAGLTLDPVSFEILTLTAPTSVVLP